MGGLRSPHPPERTPKVWRKVTRVVLGARPQTALCSAGVRSGGRGGAEPPHQRMTCMAWSPRLCRMPCADVCGSPIQKQGVRSGVCGGGAEPPHQQMTCMAWTVPYALCSCMLLPHPHCVEGSTSWPLSVEQGPFAHRELISNPCPSSTMLYGLAALHTAPQQNSAVCLSHPAPQPIAPF